MSAQNVFNLYNFYKGARFEIYPHTTRFRWSQGITVTTLTPNIINDDNRQFIGSWWGHALKPILSRRYDHILFNSSRFALIAKQITRANKLQRHGHTKRAQETSWNIERATRQQFHEPVRGSFPKTHGCNLRLLSARARFTPRARVLAHTQTRPSHILV